MRFQESPQQVRSSRSVSFGPIGPFAESASISCSATITTAVVFAKTAAIGLDLSFMPIGTFAATASIGRDLSFGPMGTLLV
jgi:hypothetical protein